jgi:hypothetical protein
VYISYTGRPQRHCPLAGSCLLTLPWTPIDLPTQHKTPAADVATLQAPVVRFPEPLILHTPNPHPDPTVEFIALAEAGAESSGKVADCAAENPVDLRDHFSIEVVTVSGTLLALLTDGRV